MFSQSIIIIITIIFLFNSLITISALPIEPDPYPDPSTVQTQILNRTSPTTIPAFPEQSQASVCPLDLPESLFHDIKSACAPKPPQNSDFYSGQLHRSRCCPVLAAWLYSAYAGTGLGLTTTKTAKAPSSQTTPFDMPDLPDDSETCVNNLEKALVNKGVVLQKPNETCDVVFCYCGIRLHPFSCPEAFRVNNGEKLMGGEAVKSLERDCFNHDGHSGGIGGCSKCLNSLYSLNADKSRRSNTTSRTRKMHNQDCELMGLTWLLNKNRSAYIHTVSAVLRALMINLDQDSDPASCSLSSDGMPLAVDSSEINNQSPSTVLRFYHHLLPISFLFCTSICFLFARY